MSKHISCFRVVFLSVWFLGLEALVSVLIMTQLVIYSLQSYAFLQHAHRADHLQVCLKKKHNKKVLSSSLIDQRQK